MLGCTTLDPPVDQVRDQELTEHYGLDSQGFRIVRYFTGPLLPPVDLGYIWEKGDEVVPPTPNISQAIPLFASIEAAQRKLVQAGAIPIAPATPLPIPLGTPLPLRTVQNTDEEGDIDAGGLALVDLEAWDEEMQDAKARAAKEEGL